MNFLRTRKTIVAIRFMKKTETILTYNDRVTFQSIELILRRLKESYTFQILNKSLQKRIYSIIVECTENIKKYSIDNLQMVIDPPGSTNISLKKQGDKFIVTAGNPILNQNVSNLISRLDEVNTLNKEGLNELYENIINKEFNMEKNGAGLGLVTIASKASSKIMYKITRLDENYSYFELKVEIN